MRYVSGMKRRSDFKYSAAFAGVFMTVTCPVICIELPHIIMAEWLNHTHATL